MQKIYSTLTVLLGLITSIAFGQKNGLLKLQVFGDGAKADHYFSIIKVPDGYLCIGKGASTAALPDNHGGEDALVVKYDTNLNLVWKKAYGGSGNDQFTNGMYTEDGHVVLCGFTESSDGDVTRPANRGRDLWVVKIKNTGQIVWQKSLGGTNRDFANAIVAPDNTNYLLMGVTSSTDGDVTGKTTVDNDVWIIKIDSAGFVNQQKLFGGSDHDGSLIAPDYYLQDKASLIKTADGGFGFVSTTKSNDRDVSGNHGDADIWVVKLNAALELAWQKCIGGLHEDAGYGLLLLNDSSYIVSGYGKSNSGDIPGYFSGTAKSSVVARLFNNGEKDWVRSFGDGVLYDAVKEANDDFTIIGFGHLGQLTNYGITHGGGKIVRMAKTGTPRWYRGIGGMNSDYVYGVVKGPDETYLSVGHTFSIEGDMTVPNMGSGDAFLVQTRALSTLYGKAFYDNNNNGIRDAGENYLKDKYWHSTSVYNDYPYKVWNIALESYPYSYRKDEEFIVSQDTGSYQIAFRSWEMDTLTYNYQPKNGYNYQFTAPGQSDTISMTVAPKYLTQDLSIGLRSDSLIINKETKVYLYVKNHGGYPVANGRLQVIKDSRLQFATSNKYGPSLASDTITWQLPEIQGDGTDTIVLVLRLPAGPSTHVGDALTLKARTEHAEDFDLSNNHYQIQPKITGAYNYKDLAISVNGTINASTNDSLRYKIYFNNLGNDTAFNVKISLIKDPKIMLYGSSGRYPLQSVRTDTATYTITKFWPQTKDSISVYYRLKSLNGINVGDSVGIQCIISPIAGEDSLNNIATTFTKFTKLASLTDLNTSIWDPLKIYKGQAFEYPLYTNNKGMDTVSGAQIKFVKHPQLNFVSASRSQASSSGDTLVWNLPTLRPGQADTVRVRMLLPESSSIALRDSIRVFSFLQHPKDTFAHNNSYRLATIVLPTPIFPDSTNTTLQPPLGIQWVRTLKGALTDEAFAVAALPDSGYLVSGVTSSTDNDFIPSPDVSGNVFINRFDKDGIKKWNRILIGDSVDRVKSILLSKDGNYLIGGDTRSRFGDFDGQHGKYDVYIFKLSPNGQILWKTMIGYQHIDLLYSMKATADGGCISIMGISDSVTALNSQWLIKLDNAGKIQWRQKLDNFLFTSAVNITPDNQYVVAGINNVSTIEKAYVLYKYDEVGNRIWQNIVGQTDPNVNQFQRVVDLYVAQDSSIYLLGDGRYSGPTPDLAYENGMHLLSEIALIKLDKNRNRLWTKFLGGSKFDEAAQLYATDDKGFLICGATESNDGNVSGNKGGSRDGWIIKVDDKGNLQWQQTIGGAGTDYLNGVTVTPNNNIIVVGGTSSPKSGDIPVATVNGDALIAQIGMTNTIRGIVYYDVNGNGNLDGNEKLLSNITVNASKESRTRSTSTQSNGDYALTVDGGKYYVSAQVNPSYYKVIPARDSVSFSGLSLADTINFAVQPMGIKKDLQVSLVGYTIPRPGFNTSYTVTYQNVGNTDILFDTIQLVKDKRQSVITTTPAYNAIKGDTLTWYISRINAFEPAKHIDITLKNAPPPQLNFNDTLVLSASIYPSSDDITPINNQTVVSQIVRGSYDPNDKTEMHDGKITPEELNNKAYLTYLIRFQNTGTDTAFRVIVRDTLESKLDAESFEMLKASHPYQLTIIDKRILEWTFNNIYLPDSNVNEKASHGYVSFRIKAKEGLKIGDHIANSASIYFDFNLPVKTNTSETFVKTNVVTAINDIDPIQQLIQLFPNPNKGRLWVHIPARIADNLRISLLNAKGEQVWSKHYGRITRAHFTEQLQLGEHPSGSYILNVTIGTKVYSYKVVISH